MSGPRKTPAVLSVTGGFDPLAEKVSDALRLARELGASQAVASSMAASGLRSQGW